MSQLSIIEEVLTLEELARYLRLPLETVERQARQGRIPGKQIENEWRFLKAAIEDWFRSKDSRQAMIEQFGVFADDKTLPELLRTIYAQRKRPETEN